MSLIFCDGFDNYTTVLDLWQLNGSDVTIRLNTGQARTGIGCLQINSGAFGPTKTFAQTPNFLCCTNWSSNSIGTVMAFSNFLADVGQNAWVVVLVVNGDGSLSVNRGPSGGGANLGTTAPLLYHFNAYNNLAMRATISPTAGTVELWVNGALVLSLSGVNTGHSNQGVANICNGCQLMGPGGVPLCFHDDVYMFDCSASPHNTFAGALRIYTIAPTANGNPVQWTPLANTNWQEVSEIPPDGDTSYNSAAAVGMLDQYVYPATSVPAGASIPFVQHEMALRIDTGSRSVASVIDNGVPVAPVALTTNYLIYPFEYDLLDGSGWSLGNFPIIAGPKVTL